VTDGAADLAPIDLLPGTSSLPSRLRGALRSNDCIALERPLIVTDLVGVLRRTGPSLPEARWAAPTSYARWPKNLV
jgi:hypothetical protein